MPRIPTLQRNAKRMVGYARVSTDRQAEQQTLQAQRTAIKDFAHQADVDLIEIFEDEGVSGAVPFLERPGGRALVGALMADVGIGVVAVTDMDRLGRDLVETALAWRALERTGVVLKAIHQPFDDSPSGTMLGQTLLAFAEFERKLITARTRSGRVRRVRNGGYLASKAPFGFRFDGQNLILDEAQAPIVSSMYDWCLSGLGVRAIARRLTALAVPTPMAGGHPKRVGHFTGEWDMGSVYKILKHPRNAGRGSYAGQPMACPAIVSDECYDAAQSKLASRKFRTETTTTRDRPLKNLIGCGTCGAPYTFESRRSRAGRWTHFYLCSWRGRHGVRAGHEAAKWRWRAEDLEQLARDFVREALPSASIPSNDEGLLAIVISQAFGQLVVSDGRLRSRDTSNMNPLLQLLGRSNGTTGFDAER